MAISGALFVAQQQPSTSDGNRSHNFGVENRPPISSVARRPNCAYVWMTLFKSTITDIAQI